MKRENIKLWYPERFETNDKKRTRKQTQRLKY